MPDQQYFMTRLDADEYLSHMTARWQEAGSVSIDPHKAFRHKMRRLWRQRDERDKASGLAPLGHERAGLVYAVWKLPLEQRKWNLVRARQYAREHTAQAEVHTVRDSYGWKTVMMAVHPDNPIIFEES